MAPRVSIRHSRDESKELCNEFGIYRNLIKSPYDVGDFYSKKIIANKKFTTKAFPADNARPSTVNAFVIITAHNVDITKGWCRL